MKRKMIRVALATLIMVTLLGNTVYATSSKDIEKQMEAAQESLEQDKEQLSEITGEIESLEGEQEGINNEIEAVNEEVIGLMASIEILEGDIEIKEGEIAVAKVELEKAIATEQLQYERMVKRLQVMYEEGETSYLQLLIESKSIQELLTRVEYIEQVHKHDDQMLADYKKAKEEVETLKANLEVEEAELIGAKEECEVEKQELETVLVQLKATSAEYDAKIASAQKQASAYAAKIKKQNEEIRKLEKQKQEAKKREEEERRKQEEERKRLEEERKKQEASQNGSQTGAGGGDTAGGGQTGTGGGDTAGGGQTETGGGGNNGGGDTGGSGPQYTGSAYQLDPSVITGANGSESGKQVALYAIQFLGNPYKAGGTSLTNGADCSGFTMTVYSNFGISIPRTSYAQRSCGTEVAYADAQPGDIICYSGHVAIYVGNGKIVHASSAKTGIKISNATYRSILSVRRVL